MIYEISIKESDKTGGKYGEPLADVPVRWFIEAKVDRDGLALMIDQLQTLAKAISIMPQESPSPESHGS